MVKSDGRKATTKRHAGFKAKAESFHRLVPEVRSYEVKPLSTWMGTPSDQSAPGTITILGDDFDEARLYVGHMEIGQNRWQWEEQDRMLSWHDGSGESEHMGHIVFEEGEVSGAGLICVGGNHFSVVLNLKPISFTCEVATNAGAYLTGGSEGVTLNWDASSAQWQQATWVPSTLQFTYGLVGKITIGQKTYEDIVAFEDLALSLPWTPMEGEFTAEVTQDLMYLFEVNGISPEPDDRSGLSEPAKDIKTVFPYKIAFQFNQFGTAFNGAMLVGENSIDGTAYAISGVVDNPAAVGLYLLEPDEGEQRVIAVHSGKLVIDGQIHESSELRGSELRWGGLGDSQCASSGLSPEGSLLFSDDGETILRGTGLSGGRRVSPSESVGLPAALSGQDSLAASLASFAAPRSEGLSPYELLNMTQFVKEEDGWVDRFQAGAMEDFYKILQHYMRPDLREEFVSHNPPELEPEVAEIALIPGKDGEQPGPWYESLSVAYLTKALAKEHDDYASKLNAVRALQQMRETVASAPVYHAQSPELYGRRWTLTYPATAQFISDQRENAAKYEDVIKKDAAEWREQVEQTVEGDEQIKKMLETVAAVEKLGLESKYWAYWIFRYCTQPAALMLLQSLSLNGNVSEGSAYTQRVQTNVALLNLLDPSGEFVQEYLNVIRLFQIFNVLPTLLDYSGNLEEYSYAVEKILEQFVDKYGDSTDPDIQKAVAASREALEQKLVQRILQAFAATASVFAGIYGWEQLAAKFERDLPSILKAVPRLTAKLVTMAAAGLGIMAFVYGVKDWDRLTDEEKAAVVTGATGVFVQIAAALVRRGVAFTAIWETAETPTAAFKAIASMDALDLAESRISNGFARWLVKTGSPIQESSEMFGNLFAEGAEADESLAVKLFGRNLDEFIGTRLGAMFAVVNIVLSSISLSKAKSGAEKAAYSLFLVAGALELIATAGAWALGAAGVTELGGWAIATIASGVTALGALAAIAGIVILLVLMERKPPSPIQKFAEGPASEAGLYMPEEAAIDSFQVYSAGGEPQRLGVAMLAGGDSSDALVIGSKTPAIGPVTNDYDTCLQLSTNALGWSRIGTLVTEGTNQFTLLLTCEDGKTVVAAPVVAAETEADKTKAKQQQWIAELTGGVARDEGNLEAANFRFYNAYWFEQTQTKLYLEMEGDGVKVGPTEAQWRLEMRPMSPQGLSMATVKLYTDQRNQTYMPYLPQPGSEPRQWALEPSLPSFLAFNAKSGAVEQLPGVPPQLTAPLKFTTTVSNALGSESKSFELEVTERQLTPAEVVR